jgi:hypothetical protein
MLIYLIVDRKFVYKRENLEKYNVYGKGSNLFLNVFSDKIKEWCIGKPYEDRFIFGPEEKKDDLRIFREYRIPEGGTLKLDYMSRKYADFIVRLENFNPEIELHNEILEFFERLTDIRELDRAIPDYKEMLSDE